MQILYKKGGAIMTSIWVEDINPTSFEKLEGDAHTDVLIIGGGITGVLCAYILKSAGIDCILVEAERICSGISKNTTAKITAQHGLIYHKILKSIGKENARLYFDAQSQALCEYSKLCRSLGCDYEKKDSYVYSLDDAKKIENELEALERIGVEADFSSASSLPFEVAGAVRLKDQAQFHPLKFVFAVAKGLPICEHTKVIELAPGKAITESGVITCKKIIVATHFPILNKHGGYFLKMYQHRSYVMSLEGAQDVDGMYVDEDGKGLSFRNYGDLLLLGGGAHRTGKNGGNWSELEDFVRTYYSKARILNKWATQDCMTLDGMAYIGQYSKSTPDLYVATGFNKWGMTSAMLSANILSDLVQEKPNPYARLFSPQRSILKPQLAVNVFESLIGMLRPTVPRCPHLGCALKYNQAEHSWDCPCHGSRFSESGKLIDNPATGDKKNIK